MDFKVYFPGGKKVYVDVNGFTVKTDQAVSGGGEGSAPDPFTLFLSSLGACAGIYVKGFCDQRGIDTNGVELSQHLEFDANTQRIGRVIINIHTPDTFPEKYKDALVQVAGLCAVKKYLKDPFEVDVVCK